MIKQNTNQMNTVNKGARILNYLIDLIVISIISQIAVTLLNDGSLANVLFFLIYLLYYLILESFFGITVEKLATGTKVVTRNNEKPKFILILFGTLLRFNPLDWLSYAFGQVQGSHDIMSKTKLVGRA